MQIFVCLNWVAYLLHLQFIWVYIEQVALHGHSLSLILNKWLYMVTHYHCEMHWLPVFQTP